MKIRIIYFVVVLLFFSNCKSYLPFASKKEKRSNIKLIKEYISLTKEEFRTVKKEDSLLYEVSLSVKSKIRPRLIERRLDSFLVKNYSLIELLYIIKIDRAFPDDPTPVEIERNANKDEPRIKFNSIEEYKAFIKKIDSGLVSNSHISTLKSPYTEVKIEDVDEKLIRDYIILTDEEFALIKQDDELLYEVYLSVKEEVNLIRFERKLHSYFSKDYSLDLVIALLKDDRANPIKGKVLNKPIRPFPKTIKDTLKENNKE